MEEEEMQSQERVRGRRMLYCCEYEKGEKEKEVFDAILWSSVCPEAINYDERHKVAAADDDYAAAATESECILFTI